MKEDAYDLVVIGAGSAGVRCARMAGNFGARVAVVEGKAFGGTCVNVGCVPKKLYMIASHLPAAVRDGQGFGWTYSEGSLDWSMLRDNVLSETRRLSGIYERLLTNAGNEVIKGFARFEDAHRIRVGDRILRGERILIATGGRPWIPPIPRHELGITSDEIFRLPNLPGRMVIVGGGYIGVEFACIFQAFGCEVELVIRGERILKGFDHSVREHLTTEMQRQGIRIHAHAQLESVRQEPSGARVATLTNGQEIHCDTVLFATGRRPNTEGLSLENAGIETDTLGAIPVDQNYATAAKSVFAVGDVTNRLNLTPMALAEGMYLARSWFGPDHHAPPSYENVPTAVFSRPNVGTVGMTESVARRHYGDIIIFRSEFRALANTVSGSQERTLMKLIVRRSDDRVVGAHMVGPEAGELIQGVAIAIQAGATKAHFDATIGVHPTLAEEFVTMRTPVGE